MAPEVFNSSHYGPPRDIYSYGMTIWSIFKEELSIESFIATDYA